MLKLNSLELEADNVGEVVHQLDVEERTQGTNVSYLVFSVVVFAGVWKDIEV